MMFFMVLNERNICKLPGMCHGGYQVFIVIIRRLALGHCIWLVFNYSKLHDQNSMTFDLQTK